MSLLKKIKKTMGELPEKPVFSFVGAGGKTTCVLKLADELAGLGMKVLVTTSTHIQHPFYLGRTGLLDADTKTIKEAGVPGKVVIAGRKLEQEKKIAGLLETQLEEVLESYDAVVIEADGAKHYPFKVPAEHEPVIYQITTHILIVESMQAFNHPLSEVCFRLEKAQEILNQADFREKQLTPEIVAKLLEKGYLEKLTGSLSNPKRKIGVIFNQQDSQTFEEKLSVPVIYEKKLEMPEKKKFFLIMLASGFSRRFGGNKLIYSMEKMPMYQILMEKLYWVRQHSEHVAGVCVVSQYERIRKSAEQYGFLAVDNSDSSQGISASIKKGIRAVHKENVKGECYCFFVTDQPHLKQETILRLLEGFQRSEKGIGAVVWNGQIGNPVIFHEKYREELLELEGDTGGKRVLKRHLEDVYLCEAEEKTELKDYDYKPEEEAEK